MLGKSILHRLICCLLLVTLLWPPGLGTPGVAWAVPGEDESSTLGQVLAGQGITGTLYRADSGFQGVWPAAPTATLTIEHYTRVQSVLAAAGGLMTDTVRQVDGTLGQFVAMASTPPSSSGYRLASGFWGGLLGFGPTPTPTPTPTWTAMWTPTPTPTATSCRGGWSVSNVRLNGGGTDVTVSPGASVRLQFDYQEWNGIADPGSIKQLVVGLVRGGWSQVIGGCAYNGIPATCPNKTSGSYDHTFSAPPEPGTYQVVVANDAQYSCSDARNNFPNQGEQQTTGGWHYHCGGHTNTYLDTYGYADPYTHRHTDQHAYNYVDSYAHLDTNGDANLDGYSNTHAEQDVNANRDRYMDGDVYSYAHPHADDH